MKQCSSLILYLVVSGTIASGQTNLFPSAGKVGIGTTSPGADLHIRTDGTNSPWLALDKNAGQETGIQFRQSGNVMFYLYSDNSDNDALKIQSTGQTGEGDATPRIEIPYINKNLYFASSGGNVAIGHKAPEYKLDVRAPVDMWKARFQGDDGYILIGPANSGWAHIYTDRPNFIFNQGIWSIPGSFSSYNTSDLSLQTHGTTRLSISHVTGHVGISTNAPSARLNVQQSSGAWNDGIRLSLMNKHWDVVADSNGDRLIIAKDQNMGNGIVLKDGNVGIGSASPIEKLTVDGTIYGKEVRVDLSVPGPDYVFDEDYNLSSLEEIKNFIDENKHLPEVPSAKEMEANGIKVGEMNMLLLKKIEELTLYLIQQQNEIQELRSEIEEIKE